MSEPRQSGVFSLKPDSRVSVSWKNCTIPFFTSSSPHLQFSFSHALKIWNEKSLKYCLQCLLNIHLSVRFIIWIRLTDGWLVVSFHNIFNPWVHIFKQKTGIYFWHVFLTETQLNANDCVPTKNHISLHTGCCKLQIIYVWKKGQGQNKIWNLVLKLINEPKIFRSQTWRYQPNQTSIYNHYIIYYRSSNWFHNMRGAPLSLMSHGAKSMLVTVHICSLNFYLLG